MPSVAFKYIVHEEIFFLGISSASQLFGPYILQGSEVREFEVWGEGGRRGAPVNELYEGLPQL